MKNSLFCIVLFFAMIFLIRFVGWSSSIFDFLMFNDIELKSLEIYLKFLIPIVTGFIGYFIFKMNKKFEHTIVLKTKVIDKRVEYYSELSDELNDIYTYLIRVGEWKDKNPKYIINSKRNVSKIMHKSKPFWSEEVFIAYRNFILSVFETNTGHRKDAKIKADTEKYGELTTEDKEYFTNIRTNKEDIKLKYTLLEKAFSKDMGVL